MLKHRKETVDQIREASLLFSNVSDETIEKLYHQWSNNMFSASWLMPNEAVIANFIKWATVTPLDYIMNKE